MRILAAKQHADFDVFVLGREHQVVNVKPVVVDGLCLGGVQVQAQVAQGLVAVHFAPQDQAHPGVDRLRRRLLVIAHLAHANA